MHSICYVAALLVALVAAAVFSADAQSLSASTSGICSSTFHLSSISAVVRNPTLDSSFIDLGELPETGRRIQIDCIDVAQAYPSAINRQCATPTDQRLQLCTQFITTNTSATWDCSRDISDYLSTPMRALSLGNFGGESIKMKLRWSSTLSDPSCFPRHFKVDIVGLSVPEPGTSVGVSVAFGVVVGGVALAALTYGAYAAWRVGNKFEHREGSNERPLDATPGHLSKREREAYRLALVAMGVPKGMVSLYDEDGPVARVSVNDNGDDDNEEEYQQQQQQQQGGGGGGNEEVFSPNQTRYGRQQQQYRPQYRGDEDDGAGDGFDGAEEGYYDDDDEEDESSPLSQRRKQQNRHYQHNGPTHIVLDNNQVVESVAVPVPWFDRLEQDQKRDSHQQPQQNQNNSNQNSNVPASSSRQRGQQQRRFDGI